MSDHIVVLSGSPRKGGNTDRLAAAFIDGAQAAGKNVSLFRTADLEIGGCRGCGHCFEEVGVCVQKDDMPPILTSLLTADALVLASPIYYWGLTAQLKLAIDRMYPLIRAKSSIQRVAMLLTCADRDEDVTEGVVFMLNHLCRAYGWENAGVVTAAGLHEKGDIARRPELDEARALGGAL